MMLYFLNKERFYHSLFFIVGVAILQACMANQDFTGIQMDSGGGQSGQSGSQSGTPTENSSTPASSIPFAPLTPQAGARKVKMLLTGGTVTDDEFKNISADMNNLKPMIKDWIASPGYQTSMMQFFSDAFQQNLASGSTYQSISPYFLVNFPIILNFRDSFAQTVLSFVNSGQPFTKVATTRSFMMTTAMMSALAYFDMQPITNSGGYVIDYMVKYPNLVIHFDSTKPNLTTDEGTDPKSPNFGTFYYPPLKGFQTSNTSCSPAPSVINFPPNNPYSAWIWYLYMYFNGQLVNWALPYPGNNGTTCFAPNGGFGAQGSDYSDWRMVTVRLPQAGERTDTFMQMDRLRKGNTLVLSTPKVGYFTTLPFLATWQSNISNQARVTVNQAMIVGLGAAFDGSNGTLAGVLPGLNPAHADPASPCYSCHRNLDPMRQFYLHDMSNYWSAQDDNDLLTTPPTFAFNSAPVQGRSLYDMGDQIAANPGFSAAWVQKLCVWANSKPCDDSDPIFKEVVNNFKSSNFNWNSMVADLMSSPLITYQTTTSTAQMTGGLVSLSRRNHLCNTLNQRLSLDDVCSQGSQIASSTGSALTSSLPGDSIARGAKYAVVPSAASVTHRMTLENICLSVADQVIDNNSLPQLSSSQDPNTSVDFLLSNLMGLASSEQVDYRDILIGHYNDSLQAAASDKSFSNSKTQIALKSTFALACMTPFVSSIGF